MGQAHGIVILILHMEKLRHGEGMRGTDHGHSVKERGGQDSDLGGLLTAVQGCSPRVPTPPSCA